MRLSLSTLLSSLLLVACAGQAVITQGRNSPNNDFAAGVVLVAEPGASFTQINEKTLDISVTSNAGHKWDPTFLFARRYAMSAADIGWTIVWLDSDRITFELVEHPVGISRYEGNRANAKPIAFLELERFPNSPTFELTHERWLVPHSTKAFAYKRQ
jgi:hypothetical protein